MDKSMVVVGTQYGDEGKGKVVDFLAEEADYIVRFAGGDNAGHTVVVDGETYKLHLLPSGVVAQKETVIGTGVVINPEVLLDEIDKLEKRGLKLNLNLSDRAHIIFPYHRMLDGCFEAFQGKLSAGSTKRGIAPVYADKSARFGLRVIDLLDKEVLKRRMDVIFRMHDLSMKHVHRKEHNLKQDELVEKYYELGQKLKPYVCDCSVLLNSALNDGKKLLFEGAQGTMLDIDWGCYPHTSSSNSTAGGVCPGTGVSPRRIGKIVGVMKAYLSRVGSGPVPTELLDETGEKIREIGGEYGTTTGRPRRCGWLDLVMVKHSHTLNHFNSIAMTKLDVLTGLPKLKICTSYEIDGKQVDTMPADLSMIERAKPVYEEVDGWSEDITKCRKFEELPENARKYIKRVEEYLGVPVSTVGIGPARDETIRRGDCGF